MASMEASQALPKAIIFAGESLVRGALLEAAKPLKFTSLIHVESGTECAAKLKELPDAWLILDFGVSTEGFNLALTAAQATSALDVRPIYVVSLALQPSVITASLEYNVSKIHIGEVNQEQIANDLQQLARIYESYGPIRAAMGQVASLEHDGKYDEAGEVLQGLAGSASTNPRVVCEYAEFLLRRNNVKGARDAVAGIVAREAGNLRIIHLQARCLMKEKKYDEAIRLLKQAEKINGFNPNRLIDLGHALLQTRQFAEADEKFSKALSIVPTSAEALGGKAQATLLQGKIQEGLDLLQSLGSPRAIASALNSAGVIAALTGSEDNAVTMYRQGIALLNDNPLLAARVWFNHGLVNFRQGKYPAALTSFEQAVRLDGKFAAAGHNVKIVKSVMEKSSSVSSSATPDNAAVIGEAPEGTLSMEDVSEEGAPGE